MTSTKRGFVVGVIVLLAVVAGIVVSQLDESLTEIVEEPTRPTGTPLPTPAPRPTATPAPTNPESTLVDSEQIRPDVVDFMTVGMTAEQRQCFNVEAEADPALVTKLNRVDIDAPPTDPRLLSEVAVIVITCAPETIAPLFSQIAEGTTSTLDDRYLEDVSACFLAEFFTDSPDRTDALTAHIAFANGFDIPEDTIDAGAALANRCIPADLFVSDIVASYKEDPVLASGLDQECVDALSPNLHGLAVQRGLLTADPLDEVHAMSAIIGQVLACVSFGRIHATSEDLDLTTSEIACLDDLLGDFSARRIDLALQGVTDAEADVLRQELIHRCLGQDS